MQEQEKERAYAAVIELKRTQALAAERARVAVRGSMAGGDAHVGGGRSRAVGRLLTLSIPCKAVVPFTVTHASSLAFALRLHKTLKRINLLLGGTA